MFDKQNKALEILALIDAMADDEVKYKLYCELEKWVKENVRYSIKKSVQKPESPIKTIS